MRIHLISVGNRLPDWVNKGYDEYARRMPGECMLRLVEIATARRTRKCDPQHAIREEGKRILKALPKHCTVGALEVDGEYWSTPRLAEKLEDWLGSGGDVALLVGGPDGLSSECRQRADFASSLSPHTLPHPLVRIVLAEQIYRAWSICTGHPYHR